MASIFTIYNLGSLGVNVDKNPIHLEDGELTKAQNAVQDTLGGAGGLRKRLGLLKFNSGAGAGSFTGGIGVPLIDLTSTSRTIWIGSTLLNNGGQWRKSTTGFTTASTQVTNATPANPRGKNIAAATTSTDYGIADFDTATSYLTGQPGSGCIINNILYYAANNYITYNAVGYSAPSIRTFDGTTDSLLLKLPVNPDVGATAVPKGVVSMLAYGGLIYFSTFDGGTSSADYRGRVFQFNPASGALTVIGATFPTGHIPYALEFHQGRLWVGTHTAGSGNPPPAGRVYFIRPGIDTSWTLDLTGVNGPNVCCLKSFNGFLYAGMMEGAGPVVYATVKQRDSLGVWTDSVTASGGTARQYNAFLSMVVFKSALYTGYYNNDNTAFNNIYKYDGTTWTVAYTAANLASAIQAQGLFVDNNTTIYAIGNSNATITLLSSTDGTTWTDRSTNFGISTNNGLSILYGIPT